MRDGGKTGSQTSEETNLTWINPASAEGQSRELIPSLVALSNLLQSANDLDAAERAIVRAESIAEANEVAPLLEADIVAQRAAILPGLLRGEGQDRDK